MWQPLIVAAYTLLQPGVAASPQPAKTADQVVAGVQAYYKSATKLDAAFRQTYTNTVFGRSSVSHGKVYVHKPGKMRWDYDRPEKKHIISDGTTLWVYEPANKQAFRQGLQDQVLPVAVTFLYGEGDLKKDFTATLDPGKYGGKTDHVIKLTPRKPSAQYKHLWLVVDSGDFHVKESIILEASDNVNQIRFTNIRLNDRARVADRHFRFTPPKGVKVIDPSTQP
jgi:outer membrane lipoprotein carrier protein